jgi:hypothetical protein
MSPHAPEDIEQHYIDAMSMELGQTFFRLLNESARVHLKWQEYVALFGTDPSRIELLNRAAAGFFRLVQESLWDDILLHISRLTDPRIVATKDTLTLERLPHLVDAELCPDAQRLLQVIHDKTLFARDWRIRRIAHPDVRAALHRGAAPLEEATRQSVEEALDAIAQLLNIIECHYCGSALTRYDRASHPGDAEALLQVLRQAVERRADRP